MGKIHIFLFCYSLSGILPLFVDEVKPLKLNEGEKYELRTVQTTVISYMKNRQLEQRKNVYSTTPHRGSVVKNVEAKS